MKHLKIFYYSFNLCLIIIAKLVGQTHFPADPFNLLKYEKAQFDDQLSINSNIFRPIFFDNDSTLLTVVLRTENIYNDNAPNQENMDIRYLSKGFLNFNSIEFSLNSAYLSLIVEPYLMNRKLINHSSINRAGPFSVLNDQILQDNHVPPSGGFRNLFGFIHYKGFGFGWHKGNRWWGPGIHTSLQMTNNTQPIPAQIIGTLKEIKIGSFGIFGLYTFAKMNREQDPLSKYYTSLNGQLTWYGPLNLTLGFSRNYLTGGIVNKNYKWTESDARKIVFEDIFISNLIDLEYTIGGHDVWDQTFSGYLNLTFPERKLKLYAEIGVNDNRMYLADFISQPDHSMATILGIRDYGNSNYKNIIWGFEWTNLMITYSSRHRPGGGGEWYERSLYDYSSYKGRRWGAHSGTDSDDWLIYAGYLSDNLMIVPALNYERHGIVTYRPAEVKLELKIDFRYKYNDIWLGIFLERQFEAFLGFPNYFYVNDSIDEDLANTRITNTLIFSLYRTISF